MKRKTTNIITGKCSGISSEGKGIIKTVYGTIFVDSLLLDEEAEIEVTYASKGISFGKIRKLLTFSKERVKPLCPISTACGGCVFQNASYRYELEYKKNKVIEDLKRIGHITNPTVNDVLGMENPYHYRNKIQVPFGQDKGKVVFGFYKANTHKIISCLSCNIEDERASKILSNIASLMEEFHIQPYNEDLRVGTIRHVLIRTSYHYDQVMVVLVSSEKTFKGRNNFIKKLVSLSPNITTIIQNTNERATNVILGEREEILYGKGYIQDEILGLKFHISSKSFFQVNPIQTEVLYNTAIKYADLNKEETLLDAYSGVGTIGLLCAKYVKHVTSVEIEPSAVKNAINNAKMNDIKNIDIILQDATEYINSTTKKFDVVIMDPPRKGSSKEFLDAVINIKPKKIIYISCDPSTLARDIEYLKDYYDIKLVQPVDMFPKTFHVETVVLLEKKTQK